MRVCVGVGRKLITTARLFKLVVLRVFDKYFSEGKPRIGGIGRLVTKFCRIGYVEGAIDLVYSRVKLVI